MNLSDEQKIVSIMKENCIHAYLATCDGDQPRVRPVSPIVEDDMSIWVTTGATSRMVSIEETSSAIANIEIVLFILILSQFLREFARLSYSHARNKYFTVTNKNN